MKIHVMIKKKNKIFIFYFQFHRNKYFLIYIQPLTYYNVVFDMEDTNTC